MKWTCELCNSDKVSHRAWVDINTLEYLNSTDDGELFCENCQKFITGKLVKE